MNAITFVATNSEDTLWAKLLPKLKDASFLRIGSAFLAGPDQITAWLTKSKNRRVEILVRLKCPTNPWTVQTLLKHPQVSIRAARAGVHYHEKLFLAFRNPISPIGAYIGSANWTPNGLERNEEAGVWITEASTLRQAAKHFSSGFSAARNITKFMLEELQADYVWERSHARRPKQRKRKRSSPWHGVRSTSSGDYLLKQNGVGWDPYWEGTEHDERSGTHAAQTVSRIPTTFEPGLGVILSSIARRKDGTPDRLIYGRGFISDFDPKRWRLPMRYLAGL